MNKVKINKKSKTYTREELENLDKDKLIDKVLQLEAYNQQLKNILQKKLNGHQQSQDDEQMDYRTSTSSPTSSPRPEVAHSETTNKKRKFDFSKSHKRHVLLKFLYFGWDYQGYACQEDSNNTIEYYLFNALTQTCLIESRTNANYHRCGRTDKGVSGFSQVISIDLRSKFPEEQQLEDHAIANEIDYCGILNRVLPPQIQCICWAPCHAKDYNARFDCLSRTYRYYFPKGDLNIESMQRACKLLERHADFRNFCKMDVQNGVTNFWRRIIKASIERCHFNAAEPEDGYAMYFLEIKANAFLFHQIRCIMEVLLLIGQQHEEISVIDELLDIEENACKPQYQPAMALPLNLFHSEFRKRDIPNDLCDSNVKTSNDQMDIDCERVENWHYPEATLRKLIEKLQNQWSQCNIKATMMRDALEHLTKTFNENFLLTTATSSNESATTELIRSQANVLHDTKVASIKNYQKLLKRRRCKSLENRIAHFVQKQRLVIKDES